VSERDGDEADQPLIAGGLHAGADGPAMLLHCSSIEGVRLLRSTFLAVAAGKDPGDIVAPASVRLDGVMSLRLRRTLDPPTKRLRIDDGDVLWTTTATEWVSMATLLEGFLDGHSGHQYLTNEGSNDADVEVSFGEAHKSL
jgi:hypothetical protein